MKRAVVAIALGMAISLSGPLGGAANAAPTPPPPVPDGATYTPNGQVDNPDRIPFDTPHASLNSSSPSGSITTQQVAPNPYNCRRVYLPAPQVWN